MVFVPYFNVGREYKTLAYRTRLTLLMLLDSSIVLSAIYISLFTLHPHIEILNYPSLLLSAITLLISHHVFAFRYRLYQKAWEYASIGELIAIAKTVTFSLILTATVQWIVYEDMYVRALMITWMIHMLLLGGSRFVWRVYRDQYMNQRKGKSGRSLSVLALLVRW